MQRSKLPVYLKRLMVVLCMLIGCFGVIWMIKREVEKDPSIWTHQVRKPPVAKFEPMTVQTIEEADVVMIGDSIIQRMQTTFEEPDGTESIWDLLFTSVKSVNLGVSGITTRGVLEILNKGLLDKGKPKIVVLLVGTNNVDDYPSEIVEGIAKIAHHIHNKHLQAKILVIELLPKGPEDNPYRQKVFKVNKLLKPRFHHTPYVELVNLDPGFVGKHGRISKDDMPDYLHLSYKAYLKAFVPLRSKIIQMMNENIVTEYAKSQKIA